MHTHTVWANAEFWNVKVGGYHSYYCALKGSTGIPLHLQVTNHTRYTIQNNFTHFSSLIPYVYTV